MLSSMTEFLVVSTSCYLLPCKLLFAFAGHYAEVFPPNASEFVASLKVRFLSDVGDLRAASLCKESFDGCLYLPRGDSLDAPYYSLLRGRNAKVADVLDKLRWGMPNFRPTIKYHKDPLKLRPVICKRGTPSIGVGKLINSVLKEVR